MKPNQHQNKGTLASFEGGISFSGWGKRIWLSQPSTALYTWSTILDQGGGQEVEFPLGSGPFLDFLSVECPHVFQESYALPTWLKKILEQY